ncbi:methionine ABC transporter permease [Acinetobacter rudis]|uniref:Methionine ABC transporter permease n=1 Tax=Acinetobacter rudis TaxID=632955 RepID=A0AAW8JAP5_9GAMM|nr:methionine ABC transporter permease [Acinetobacter rudis]MDQ8936728.1 methionine ABC transporter permease [Acinetobacter rudis]MDQ9018949.1 methionine ABC transporter permease [Acinetobacter rudis]
MRELIVQFLTSVTQPFWHSVVTMDEFVTAMQETLYMLFLAMLLGSVWGFIQAITLWLTRPQGILSNRLIYNSLGPIVNALRSLPFIILLIALIPLTKILTGTNIGVWAAIVPLTFYIGPYIGRLLEISLLEVNPGIVESAQAMGASPAQIIFKFVIPEARSSLILNLTSASISLLGATAMAGAVGAGGIGALAIDYGYNRFDGSVVTLTVIILLIMVQIIQMIGERLSRLR